jgi:hypothetical protein
MADMARLNLWLTWIASLAGVLSLFLWLFSGEAGWIVLMLLAACGTWFLMWWITDITAARSAKRQKEEDR